MFQTGSPFGGNTANRNVFSNTPLMFSGAGNTTGSGQGWGSFFGQNQSQQMQPKFGSSDQQKSIFGQSNTQNIGGFNTGFFGNSSQNTTSGFGSFGGNTSSSWRMGATPSSIDAFLEPKPFKPVRSKDGTSHMSIIPHLQDHSLEEVRWRFLEVSAGGGGGGFNTSQSNQSGDGRSLFFNTQGSSSGGDFFGQGGNQSISVGNASKSMFGPEFNTQTQQSGGGIFGSGTASNYFGGFTGSEQPFFSNTQQSAAPPFFGDQNKQQPAQTKSIFSNWGGASGVASAAPPGSSSSTPFFGGVQTGGFGGFSQTSALFGNSSLSFSGATPIGSNNTLGGFSSSIDMIGGSKPPGTITGPFNKLTDNLPSGNTLGIGLPGSLDKSQPGAAGKFPFMSWSSSNAASNTVGSSSFGGSNLLGSLFPGTTGSVTGFPGPSFNAGTSLLGATSQPISSWGVLGSAGGGSLLKFPSQQPLTTGASLTSSSTAAFGSHGLASSSSNSMLMPGSYSSGLFAGTSNFTQLPSSDPTKNFPSLGFAQAPQPSSDPYGLNGLFSSNNYTLSSKKPEVSAFEFPGKPSLHAVAGGSSALWKPEAARLYTGRPSRELMIPISRNTLRESLGINDGFALTPSAIQSALIRPPPSDSSHSNREWLHVNSARVARRSQLNFTKHKSQPLSLTPLDDIPETPLPPTSQNGVLLSPSSRMGAGDDYLQSPNASIRGVVIENVADILPSNRYLASHQPNPTAALEQHTEMALPASSMKAFDSLRPILTKPGYSTTPSMQTIQEMTEYELSRVADFTIKREAYGEILWPGYSDIRQLNLDDIVEIDDLVISMYERETPLPPVDTGLNKRAILTLKNCRPTKRNAFVEDPQWAEIHKVKIEAYTESMGAKFISLDTNTWDWKFEISHFSKYGLPRNWEETLNTAALAKFPRKQEDGEMHIDGTSLFAHTPLREEDGKGLGFGQKRSRMVATPRTHSIIAANRYPPGVPTHTLTDELPSQGASPVLIESPFGLPPSRDAQSAVSPPFTGQVPIATRGFSSVYEGISPYNASQRGVYAVESGASPAPNRGVYVAEGLTSVHQRGTHAVGNLATHTENAVRSQFLGGFKQPMHERTIPPPSQEHTTHPSYTMLERSGLPSLHIQSSPVLASALRASPSPLPGKSKFFLEDHFAIQSGPLASQSFFSRRSGGRLQAESSPEQEGGRGLFAGGGEAYPPPFFAPHSTQVGSRGVDSYSRSDEALHEAYPSSSLEVFEADGGVRTPTGGAHLPRLSTPKKGWGVSPSSPLNNMGGQNGLSPTREGATPNLTRVRGMEAGGLPPSSLTPFSAHSSPRSLTCPSPYQREEEEEEESRIFAHSTNNGLAAHTNPSVGSVLTEGGGGRGGGGSFLLSSSGQFLRNTNHLPPPGSTSHCAEPEKLPLSRGLEGIDKLIPSGDAQHTSSAFGTFPNETHTPLTREILPARGSSTLGESVHAKPAFSPLGHALQSPSTPLEQDSLPLQSQFFPPYSTHEKDVEAGLSLRDLEAVRQELSVPYHLPHDALMEMTFCPRLTITSMGLIALPHARNSRFISILRLSPFSSKAGGLFDLGEVPRVEDARNCMNLVKKMAKEEEGVEGGCGEQQGQNGQPSTQFTGEKGGSSPQSSYQSVALNYGDCLKRLLTVEDVCALEESGGRGGYCYGLYDEDVVSCFGGTMVMRLVESTNHQLLHLLNKVDKGGNRFDLLKTLRTIPSVYIHVIMSEFASILDMCESRVCDGLQQKELDRLIESQLRCSRFEADAYSGAVPSRVSQVMKNSTLETYYLVPYALEVWELVSILLQHGSPSPALSDDTMLKASTLLPEPLEGGDVSKPPTTTPSELCAIYDKVNWWFERVNFRSVVRRLTAMYMLKKRGARLPQGGELTPSTSYSHYPLVLCAFYFLSCGKVAEAMQCLLGEDFARAGDPLKFSQAFVQLLLLLSLHANREIDRDSMLMQVAFLKKLGWEDNVPVDVRRLYQLLAGDLSDLVADAAIDWRTLVAAHLWFPNPTLDLKIEMTPPPQVLNGSRYLLRALSHFEESCTTINQVKLAAPLAPYIPTLRLNYLGGEQEGKKARGWLKGIDLSKAVDCQYSLLRVYSGLERLNFKLFDTQTHTKYPLDCSLSWPLSWTLFFAAKLHHFGDAWRADERLLRHQLTRLNSCFATQLEMMGLWQWACFVYTLMDDKVFARFAINEIVLRNAYSEADEGRFDEGRAPLIPENKSELQKLSLVLQSVGIPLAWCDEALALRMKAQWRYVEASFHFYEAYLKIKQFNQSYTSTGRSRSWYHKTIGVEENSNEQFFNEKLAVEYIHSSVECLCFFLPKYLLNALHEELDESASFSLFPLSRRQEDEGEEGVPSYASDAVDYVRRNRFITDLMESFDAEAFSSHSELRKKLRMYVECWKWLTEREKESLGELNLRGLLPNPPAMGFFEEKNDATGLNHLPAPSMELDFFPTVSSTVVIVTPPEGGGNDEKLGENDGGRQEGELASGRGKMVGVRTPRVNEKGGPYSFADDEGALKSSSFQLGGGRHTHTNSNMHTHPHADVHETVRLSRADQSATTFEIGAQLPKGSLKSQHTMQLISMVSSALERLKKTEESTGFGGVVSADEADEKAFLSEMLDKLRE